MNQPTLAPEAPPLPAFDFEDVRVIAQWRAAHEPDGDLGEQYDDPDPGDDAWWDDDDLYRDGGQR